VHENIHAPGIFFRQILSDIKVRNRSGDLRRKGTYIEILELADAGPALTNILPGSFKLIANRGNDSHAGNDDTSLAQEFIRGFEKLVQRPSTAPT
jgi:hypothetical protein